jgi:hypothetical protein
MGGAAHHRAARPFAVASPAWLCMTGMTAGAQRSLYRATKP